MAFNIPLDRLYTTEHEWAKIEGDVATIGITDHAQSQLGDVVYLELPGIGTSLEKGKILGVVESIKAVSDLYCPLSGDVVEANDILVDSPETVNQSAYDQAWMLKIKLSDKSEVDSMLNANAYRELLEQEAKD